MRCLLAIALLPLVSCNILHTRGNAFEVLPATPEYVLRSPASNETPFSETLKQYNGFVAGQNWLDLHPRMRLRIENAYYREGAPKRGLEGFLGTEIALYRMRKNGSLHLISVESKVDDRPPDQPPVQNLLPEAQARCREHRFFFAVKFSRRGSVTPSVLLGANSVSELRKLAAQLEKSPESVCGAHSAHCTIFPESCSVSSEIEIVVNGARRTVLWGSTLASVAATPRRVELRRLHDGHLVPVKIDASDAAALRLPLLPGDRLHWE